MRVDMSILPQHQRVMHSPHRQVASAECAAPECHAKPLPMLRVPLCRDCARDAAYQYFAEMSAAIAPDADQTEAEAARAAAGEFETVGVVYFIRLGSRIKIGYTTDVIRRMSALPHEEFLGMVPGTMRDEARCHAAFNHIRMAGEWFEDTPDLRAFIAATIDPTT